MEGEDTRSKNPKPKVPDPTDPIKDVEGEITLLTEIAIAIDGKAYFKYKNVIPDENLYKHVKAKVQGKYLISLEYVDPPKKEEPKPEIKKGHGVIKTIDPSKPLLEYTYYWKDKSSGELKSSVQQLNAVIDGIDLSKFKEGDRVYVNFSKKGNTYTIHEINLDTYEKSKYKQGNRYQSDPTIDLIKNLSILHEASLDKAEKFMEFCLKEGISSEDRSRFWIEIIDHTIEASLKLYEKIGDKYKIKE